MAVPSPAERFEHERDIVAENADLRATIAHLRSGLDAAHRRIAFLEQAHENILRWTVAAFPSRPRE